MGSNLELLTGILGHIGRFIDRIEVFLRWQRDWTDHDGTASFSRLNDLGDALVNHLMIVGLQADTNALSWGFFFSTSCQGAVSGTGPSKGLSPRLVIS